MALLPPTSPCALSFAILFYTGLHIPIPCIPVFYGPSFPLLITKFYPQLYYENLFENLFEQKACQQLY